MTQGTRHSMSTFQSNPYLVQKIMTASPEELIKYVYDAAITACAREDHSRALQAVQELINALNFETGEVAQTFYKVYNSIMERIHKREFEEAREQLISIRTTWNRAMNLD